MLGNDLRIMTPSALTIVNNPAIIALSQDPHGRSLHRVQRKVEGIPKDEYGMGETHVWSGKLENGDYAVILVNFGGEDLTMSISLDEIFVASGPHGSSPLAKTSWAVHDLWANRMDTKVAEEIIKTEDAGERAELFRKANWYNATEIPYKVGLEKGDKRLFGKKIATIEAHGVLGAKVKRHAAQVFRLRKLADSGEHLLETEKDEL